MAARKTKKTTKLPTTKKTSKLPATKKTSTSATAAPKQVSGARKSAAGAVSSKTVNMGNVFALRPRVNTSFRQENFLEARRLLDEESYATPEEATRAVAERALDLSNDPGGKRGRKRGR